MMKTKCFALEMADGSVSIMQTFGEVTAAGCIAKWSAADRAKVVSHKQIELAVIPADRTFRGAWKINGAAIDHDMEKARDIQRNRLREARAPMLAALDIEYDRADETGDAAAKQDIASQKQVLRDITADPRLSAATSPAELKAVWPLASVLVVRMK